MEPAAGPPTTTAPPDRGPAFRAVAPEVDFVALERAELDRWRAQRVFERSVAQRAGAPAWVFYEGPPTANGRPGLHHVWARVYKDLFCRHRTMQGFEVPRRAGWDTHGLPVEVEVEKRLGISGKRQIEEEVGVAEFVALSRASVLEYVDEFRRLSERIGYWLDFDDAYWTMDPGYVESVWWHLKVLFDKGLLYEDLKVVPYCPRCGTALSSHELGQAGVYADEVDESAYVRLPLVDADEAALGPAADLVVWTTTPWTLPSNTGVAVNPTLTYAVVDGMVVAADLVERVFGDGAGQRVAARFPGSALVGRHYRRPLDDLAVAPEAGGFVVVPADYVTTDEGTGLVHLAPAFGEIDRQLGREHSLPTLNPVGPDGRFTDELGWLAGRDVREANHDINDRLAADGLLVRRELHTHSYPHCWRCGTALIYWGKPSWYIATSSHKDDLLAANQAIDWHPAHIRDGRFGEWLSNNVDWALSRDRFWGTPLPIWRCDDGHTLCIGSLAELSELAGRDVTSVDPHRPAIDEVTFACPRCAATVAASSAAGAALGDVEPGLDVPLARRVEPVIDAWFDSGSMPAAQVGYPHRPGSEEALRYPADFISEAIDQTRGWFYSLLAVNVLVFGRGSPYRHVVCLGHIVDADGRKMSKSIGNVIDPWEILDTRGADALRWWMFSQGSPWTPTRAGMAAIDTSLRELLLTLWNTFSFFTTYASLNGFDPAAPDLPAAGERPELDRWIRSRLATTSAEVTDALDAYEPLDAALALGRLVDDLSNWYVRRSRRRFWRTDPDAPPTDSAAAHATLYEVLVEVSLLLAPFCPFVADVMWRELTGAAADDSVHLQRWPTADRRPVADGGPVDRRLEAQMALARRLASLGRAARSEAGVKVRQPLARALVHLPAGAADLPPGVVEDELNVDRVDVTAELSAVLAFELVPNFRVLGPRLGPAAGQVKAALAGIDGAAASATLESGGSITVDLASGPVELGPGDVELRVRARAGFAVSREGGEVVALDLTLDDDLRRRGLAREVVRHVQDLRKAAGLDVADRIRLWLVGLDDLEPVVDQVAREVLAVEVAAGPGPGEGTALPLDGHPEARAWVEKVGAEGLRPSSGGTSSA
ncbi:MAG: isoleucine--tRNA ligase [Acidimicrobiales bacterium]